MSMEKMKEVFSNEAFVKSLFELETAAEVRSALNEKGVELSEEEILSIRELLVKVESGEITKEQLAVWQQQAEDGELSEEALEQVAGGIGLIGGIIITAIVETVIGGLATTAIVKMATGRLW